MHAVAQYDRTMKRLTSVFTRDYVRFALGADVKRAEPLAVEEQDKEADMSLEPAVIGPSHGSASKTGCAP